MADTKPEEVKPEVVRIDKCSANVKQKIRSMVGLEDKQAEAAGLAKELLQKLSHIDKLNKEFINKQGFDYLNSKTRNQLKKIKDYIDGKVASGTRGSNTSKEKKEELLKEFRSNMKKRKWTSKDVRQFLKTKDLEPKNPIAFFGDLLNPEVDKTIIADGERADRTYRFK